MDGNSRKSTFADLKITKVIAGGKEVFDGSVIFYPRANFTITGPGNAILQLLIDGVAKHNSQTNAAGDGFFLVDNLPEGLHEYRLAHEEDEPSDPFALTSVVTKPFIQTLEDSSGPVENGGQTEETDLQIKGFAKEGQIKILNGAVVEPIATFEVERDRSWGGNLNLTSGQVYSLKARADDRKDSDIYTVTVGKVSENEVKITSLKDSAGTDIADGGTTADTKLKISGSAEDGEIKLLEGASTEPVATFTAADGTWGGEFDLTAGKTYVLKAQAEGGEESGTYTVIVSKTPGGEVKIIRIEDSEGTLVPDKGTTADTKLKIMGSAEDGYITLLTDDDLEPIDTYMVMDGSWSGELELADGQTYALKAQADDGQESEVYTVIISEAPGDRVSITALTGESGRVFHLTVTTDTELTITGTASSSKVEVMDIGGVIKTIDVLNGNWEGELAFSSDTRHILAAKSPTGVPGQRIEFYVGEAKQPEITRIQEIGGDGKDLQDGDETTVTTLSFTGKAAGHFVGTLRNGETTVMPFYVDLDSSWQATASLLEPGVCVFKAVARFGSESAPITITVKAPENPEARQER
ncbi:hypothetical protein HU755_11300 [Pseudomonas sp. SWRI111]|uniref:hypothetical protein n=1 Tax=Pseudomonas sp. SWRI111 TaxID=2745507 RepID=UPI001644F46B|nr:hypothetical protein [Pseudomonas sp. SWRI111]MBC3207375.1 hypothetical protein [Pseudomonas sp. SWRI111]